MRPPMFAVITLPLTLTFAMLAQPANAQHPLQQRLAQRAAAIESSTLPAGTRVERDIAYGPDPLQRYDVYLPAQAKPNAPILLMVHGGGWHRGDKTSPGVVENKARDWLAQGYIFVSSNYRLVPEADPLTQALDIAAATAAVQAQAPHWGADPQQMLLLGHSAGAHLVALLGSIPELLLQAGASLPKGIIALDSGALDVPALMAQPYLPALYRNAFGDDPAYWRAASPQQQLRRDGLPMLLVCSSTRSFPTSPCDEAHKLAQRAAWLSVPVRVLPEALSHGDINSQLGLPSTYTWAVNRWIEQQLTEVRHRP